MAPHSSVLAWRIPGTGEPGGLPSMGSHRVGHDWSNLAAAATSAVAAYKQKYHICVCINIRISIIWSQKEVKAKSCYIGTILRMPQEYHRNYWSQTLESSYTWRGKRCDWEETFEKFAQCRQYSIFMYILEVISFVFTLYFLSIPVLLHICFVFALFCILLSLWRVYKFLSRENYSQLDNWEFANLLVGEVYWFLGSAFRKRWTLWDSSKRKLLIHNSGS